MEDLVVETWKWLAFGSDDSREAVVVSSLLGEDSRILPLFSEEEDSKVCPMVVYGVCDFSSHNISPHDTFSLHPNPNPYPYRHPNTDPDHQGELKGLKGHQQKFGNGF